MARRFQPQRPYIPEFDVVRALAIVGVFIVHGTADIVVGLAGEGRLYPLYVVLNRMGAVGTTTFIFLSSLVLSYRYAGADSGGGILRRFYSRRLRFILLPYLGWTVFYHLWRKVLEAPGAPIGSPAAWAAAAAALSPGQLAAEFLYGKAYFHLYFVVVNLQFYVLFPVLLVVLRGRRPAGFAPFWIGLGLQWLAYVLNALYWHVPWKGSLATTYLSLYGLGWVTAADPAGFVRRLDEPVRPSWGRLTRMRVVIAAWLAAGVTYAGLYGHLWAGGPPFPTVVYEFAWNVYTLLSCVVLCAAGFRLYQRLSEAMLQRVTAFGRAAFGMYLIHPIWLYLWQRLRLFPDSPALMAAGGILVPAVVSWCLVAAAHRLAPRWAWIALGASNPARRS